MSQPEMTEEQVVEAVYDYAAQRMMAGISHAQIEKDLIEKGLDQEAAHTVVSNLNDMKSKAVRGAATKNMLIGGLICAVGTVITVWSYTAAANNAQGGSYVVAWGAIIFGAIQFFRGVAQLGG